MIPQNYITAWRAYAPWVNDAHIEQDLILSRAIIEIYSQELLAQELAFRGGTALHKLFFASPLRYSEDIDLVQITAGPNGNIINALRSRFDSWLGLPKRKIKKDRVILIYRFNSEILPIIPMRLKIEINTHENFVVEKLEKRTYTIMNPWFSGRGEILTYSIEELLGTKLRALFQRKKGRDLFDFWATFENFPHLDCEKIIFCFKKYLEHDNIKISKTEFESNLVSKMSDSSFLHDIRPLIRPDFLNAYNPELAFEKLTRNLISKF